MCDSSARLPHPVSWPASALSFGSEHTDQASLVPPPWGAASSVVFALASGSSSPIVLPFTSRGQHVGASDSVSHIVSNIETVDVSQWPVLVIRKAGSPGLESLRAQFEEIHRIQRENPEFYAQIIDARGAAPPTPQERKFIAEQGKLNMQHTSKYCCGVAFVLDSAVMRGVMTAITWLHRHENPHKVFATEPDAMVWAREVIEVRRAS